MFRNEQPGRGCHALQGFAVDGRKVAKLQFSVRGRDIGLQLDGQLNGQPGAMITFYDDRRATIGEGDVGPLTITADWKRVEKTIAVPLKAREAILRIGLLGATGEMSLDDVKLSVAP